MKNVKNVKFLMLFFLMGCGVIEPDTPLNEIKAKDTEGRINVTRIGVFPDTLAYGDKRGIYVIKDNYSGKEYIGISGIGISEVGSHSSDDDKVQDER